MDVRAVSDLSPAERAAFFDRDAGVSEVEESVSEIISRVSSEGDVALRSYASEFDDVEVGNLDITDEAERGYEAVDPDLRDAIETASTGGNSAGATGHSNASAFTHPVAWPVTPQACSWASSRRR